MLTVTSPCFSEPSCNQLNIDAVTRRVEDVSESSAVGVFKPWTIFKPYLTAHQQPSEVRRLCEAIIASFGRIYTEEPDSTDARVDGVTVYDTRNAHYLATWA